MKTTVLLLALLMLYGIAGRMDQDAAQAFDSDPLEVRQCPAPLEPEDVASAMQSPNDMVFVNGRPAPRRQAVLCALRRMA